LENLPFPELSVAHPFSVLELAEEINSDYCKICLDTGHCVILDDPSKAAMHLGGDWIKAVHLHDNYGVIDQHKFPFDGIVDWKNFCKALNEIGFVGMMDFETWARGNYPPQIKEHLEQGFSMLTDYIVNLN
jgi:sugar phosphate isomerase/epimerase